MKTSIIDARYEELHILDLRDDLYVPHLNDVMLHLAEAGVRACEQAFVLQLLHNLLDTSPQAQPPLSLSRLAQLVGITRNNAKKLLERLRVKGALIYEYVAGVGYTIDVQPLFQKIRLVLGYPLRKVDETRAELHARRAAAWDVRRAKKTAHLHLVSTPAPEEEPAPAAPPAAAPDAPPPAVFPTQAPDLAPEEQPETAPNQPSVAALLWGNAQDALRQQLSDALYSNWVYGAKGTSIKGQVLIVHCTWGAQKQRLDREVVWQNIILRTLQHYSQGRVTAVEFRYRPKNILERIGLGITATFGGGG
jgi:biotin operon repressor